MTSPIVWIISSLIMALAIAAGAAINSRAQKRRVAVSAEDASRGVLAVLRLPRWQAIILRVVGIPISILGLPVLLVGLSPKGKAEGPAPLIAGACMIVGGLALAFMGSYIRRSWVEVYEQHLVVRTGKGQLETVTFSQIASLEPRISRYGGIEARGADRRKLFSVDGSCPGYADFKAFLRYHLPQQWQAFQETYGGVPDSPE